MSEARLKTAIVIIAGGRATRLGGVDKLLLPLGAGRVVDHIFERTGDLPVALNVNGDAARFADLALPVIPDHNTAYDGPLAGVRAALEWAANQGFDEVVTLAGDTPFLPADLLARLMAVNGAAVAASKDEGGRLNRQPVIAKWPVAARFDMAKWLSDGDRKMGLALDRVGAKPVEFQGGESRWRDPFFNINTPADHGFARARALANVTGGRNILGVTGWKNAGKTTLVTQIIAALSAQGLRVASLKNAHAGFEIDHEGRDSFRHRQAGAREVLVASPNRLAQISEINAMPAFETVIARLAPADIYIVEGFKNEAHLKLEILGGGAPIHNEASLRARSVIATAAPETRTQPPDFPHFHRDDIAGIAAFVLDVFDLEGGPYERASE